MGLRGRLNQGNVVERKIPLFGWFSVILILMS